MGKINSYILSLPQLDEPVDYFEFQVKFEDSAGDVNGYSDNSDLARIVKFASTGNVTRCGYTAYFEGEVVKRAELFQTVPYNSAYAANGAFCLMEVGPAVVAGPN